MLKQRNNSFSIQFSVNTEERKSYFKDVRQILVIKLRHIGDVLLTTPVFRALKKSFPDTEISALVNKGTDDVLRDNPFIKEIITLDREIKKGPFIKRLSGEIRFLKGIKQRHFDMAIDLTGGDRAAIISAISGARYRIGWESRRGFAGKRYLYTHLFRPDGQKHMVLQNLEVLKSGGIIAHDTEVDFFIPEDARAFIRDIIREKGLDPAAPIVHVHPTSRWLFKCWRDEYMAKVINWLIERDLNVIVTSSPDKKELERAKRIISISSSRVIDLCGKTTIKELAAASEASYIFFGVDSAPMHIAASVGTPVIALFGPSGAFSWGPWDNTQRPEITPYPKKSGIQRCGIHTVIQKDWDCIPCGRDGCNGTKISKCLEEIRPEEVITIISERLFNSDNKNQADW